MRELPQPARGAVYVLWATALLGVAGLSVHLATGLGEAAHQPLLIGTYVALAALCLARAALVRDVRLPWLLLGLGMLLWAGGYAYFHGVLAKREAPPYPSAADGLWLGYYACAFAAFVVLMRARVSRMRSSVWLDALLGVLALSALASAVLVDPILESTGGRLSAVATGLAYPLADVLILGVILSVFALHGWRPGRMWIILGLAQATFLVADVIYLHQSAVGAYTGDTLLELSWLAAILAITYAGWLPQEVRPAVSFDGLAPLVAPSIFALGGLALTAHGLFSERADVASVLIIATLVAGFARASTALAEARSLSRSQSLLARQALILDSAGEGILSLDLAGRVTLANAAALRLTGFSADELVGRGHHDLVQPTLADGTPYPFAESPVFASLRSGTVREVADGVFRRKDGGSFPIEYSVTPIVEHRAVTGAVLVFRDVSERREVERMKDEFTSIVSHELRTPLTAIRGSLGLLAGGALGPLGDKAQQMTEVAVDNADRLLQLINDMLDIGRMASGASTLQRVDCDVAEIAGECVATMGPLAAAAGIEIVAETEPAPLWGDRDRILQTLTNLVSNAIKFSAAQSAIRVQTGHSGDDVVVRISDEGRGIPADKLASAFERFEQVDASDSREKGGTGLGLAICHQIVTQHGGRIWVESEPGKGSTFSFTLPAARERVAPAAAPEAPATSQGGPPLVLVCDDDARTRAAVSEAVAAGGYRVATAASGREALRLAAQETPDAILLDLLMPGMDGWQTAAALRQQPGLGDVPVVILSVLTEAETDPIAADVVAWLEKPVHERQLLDVLWEAAGRPALPAQVLLVEDDLDLASMLRAIFERQGIETHHAATGPEAIELAERVQPDLLVLDLGLPGCDGSQMVEWLRSLGRTALLVHTARDVNTAFLTKNGNASHRLHERVMSLLSYISPTERNGAEPRERQAQPAGR